MVNEENVDKAIDALFDNDTFKNQEKGIAAIALMYIMADNIFKDGSAEHMMKAKSAITVLDKYSNTNPGRVEQASGLTERIEKLFKELELTNLESAEVAEVCLVGLILENEEKIA